MSKHKLYSVVEVPTSLLDLDESITVRDLAAAVQNLKDEYGAHALLTSTSFSPISLEVMPSKKQKIVSPLPRILSVNEYFKHYDIDKRKITAMLTEVDNQAILSFYSDHRHDYIIWMRIQSENITWDSRKIVKSRIDTKTLRVYNQFEKAILEHITNYINTYMESCLISVDLNTD